MVNYIPLCFLFSGYTEANRFHQSDRQDWGTSSSELDYEVYSMLFEVSGVYKLHGFGRYEGIYLKMASELGGLLQGLTPIWTKTYRTGSQFFIFFNHRSEQWELHEKLSGLSFTDCRLFCKTGIYRHF